MMFGKQKRNQVRVSSSNKSMLKFKDFEKQFKKVFSNYRQALNDHKDDGLSHDVSVAHQPRVTVDAADVPAINNDEDEESPIGDVMSFDSLPTDVSMMALRPGRRLSSVSTASSLMSEDTESGGVPLDDVSGTRSLSSCKQSITDGSSSSNNSPRASGPRDAPTLDVTIWKRLDRRSAPGALTPGQDRSISGSTLVNSPASQPLTPLTFVRDFSANGRPLLDASLVPLSLTPTSPSGCPFMKHVGPSKYVDDLKGKFLESITLILMAKDKECDEILAQSEASIKVAYQLDLEERLAKLAKETKMAVDEEWSAANAVAESNLQIEIEELKDELEYAKQDLKVMEETTKQLRRKTRTEIHALNTEHKRQLKDVQKAWSEKLQATENDHEKTLVDFQLRSHETNSDLRQQVTTLSQQIQIEEQRVQQATGWALDLGAAEEHIPFNLGPLAHVAEAIHQESQPSSSHQSRYEHVISIAGADQENNGIAQQLRVAHQIIGHYQADNEKCQAENWKYWNRIIELTAALDENPEQNAEVLGHLEGKNEIIRQFQGHLSEAYAILEKERKTRKMEKQLFLNKIDTVCKEQEQDAVKNRLLWKENDQLREQNHSLLAQAAQGPTRNEFDVAYAAHYDLLCKANRELEHEAEGFGSHRKEMGEEINRLKAEILVFELQAPEASPDRHIEELQRQINELMYDKETLGIELDIARNSAFHEDLESQREIQTQVLRGKCQRIAELEAKLGTESNTESVEEGGNESTIQFF